MSHANGMGTTGPGTEMPAAGVRSLRNAIKFWKKKSSSDMKCLVQSRQNLKWTSFFDCIQSPEPRCSPPPCSAVCEPRCECDPGYIRGYDGLCVQPEECFADEQCPPGEHYNQCSNVCDEIYCCPNTRCGIPLQEFCYQSIGKLKNHWSMIRIRKLPSKKNGRFQLEIDCVFDWNK